MPRRLHNCAPIAALLAVLAFASPAVSAEDAPKVPAPPLFEGPKASYTLPGAITSSDDKTTTGLIYTTLGKPMTIYDRAKKRYVEFPLADVARIDVAVEEEHDEPYWYWKESGSDEKVFTGNTYPWRKYLTTVTFASGKSIAGDMAGPLYIETPSGEKKQFILHKRDKGKEGQNLADLLYVKSVVLSPDSPPADKEDSPALSKTLFRRTRKNGDWLGISAPFRKPVPVPSFSGPTCFQSATSLTEQLRPPHSPAAVVRS